MKINELREVMLTVVPNVRKDISSYTNRGYNEAINDIKDNIEKYLSVIEEPKVEVKSYPEVHRQLLVNDLCRKCEKRETCELDVSYTAKCSEFIYGSIYHITDEKPKVEKVKKYKYVCKCCDTIKCTVISVRDIYPERCSYCYKAKWKLKKEKV